jgi:predicted aspartyl protease
VILKGNIHTNNHPYLDLVVRGSKKAIKITAMFDCGYSGYLCLPMTTAVDLGLTLVKTCSYELADGTIIENNPICDGQLLWDGKWEDIEIHLAKTGEPLLGISWPVRLGGKVVIDYCSGDDFWIEI